jgi:peroxiredoxin Q/BCP
MKRVQAGDPAPDFDVTAHTGEQLRLSDLRQKKAVVLFFYPKDGTSTCTKEACAFRDAYEQFVEAGAVVIGVSAGSLKSHSAFAAQHRLPFYLVSDEDGSLRKAFGVPKTLGLFPGRVTYVIGRGGVVRFAFNSQLAAGRHVDQALRVVEELVRGESANGPSSVEPDMGRDKT